MADVTTNEADLRKAAVKRLKKKRDFKSHLITYVIVNAALVGVWALSGQGYFWPAWVIGGWGIGVALNAWEVYGRQNTITEDQVQKEMEKLKS